MDNIEIFTDSQNRIHGNRELRKRTEASIRNTSVINEGFLSNKTPYFSDCHVFFEENLTLISAYKFTDKGLKTAILNFANPVEPGGGVLRGASAQEEYLCRASNLYPCLISEQAKDFYRKHNNILKHNQFKSMFLGTDMLIYSPDITFFREDKNYYPDIECSPSQEYSAHWRSVDVITCAAPFFSESGYILPNGDLYHLFCRRIQNIFEAAIDHNVEALILGAFGCGAFHNPPSVVAKAFQSVLMKDRYFHAFSNVVFAVKRSGWFSENIEAFEIAFQKFPPTGEYVFSPERNKRRFFE